MYSKPPFSYLTACNTFLFNLLSFFHSTSYLFCELTAMMRCAAGEAASPLQPDHVLPASFPGRDRQCLLPLVVEVVAEGHSVLIFCVSRNACQTCAALVGDGLREMLGPPSAAQQAARQQLVQDLETAMGGYRNELLEKLMGECARGMFTKKPNDKMMSRFCFDAFVLGAPGSFSPKLLLIWSPVAASLELCKCDILNCFCSATFTAVNGVA